MKIILASMVSILLLGSTGIAAGTQLRLSCNAALTHATGKTEIAEAEVLLLDPAIVPIEEKLTQELGELEIVRSNPTMTKKIINLFVGEKALLFSPIVLKLYEANSFSLDSRLLPVVVERPEAIANRGGVEVDFNIASKQVAKVFTVRLQCSRGRFNQIQLTKQAANPLFAFSEVMECMLEKLNRHGDRTRVQNIRSLRRLKVGSRRISNQEVQRE